MTRQYYEMVKNKSFALCLISPVIECSKNSWIQKNTLKSILNVFNSPAAGDFHIFLYKITGEIHITWVFIASKLSMQHKKKKIKINEERRDIFLFIH